MSRIAKILEDGLRATKTIDWNESFGIDHGACIPIAVFGAAFVKASGIEARVVECDVRFVDPLSRIEAVLATSEPLHDARNETGLPFLGHCAFHIPTHRLVVDMSLWTQGTTTLKNLGSPDMAIGVMDHTRGHEGFKVKSGRGFGTYRVYPKRDGWQHRRWPYEQLREMATEARLARGDFAFLGE